MSGESGDAPRADGGGAGDDLRAAARVFRDVGVTGDGVGAADGVTGATGVTPGDAPASAAPARGGRPSR